MGLDIVLRNWRRTALVAALCVLAAIVYLATATYKYRAEMRVMQAPTQTTSSSQQMNALSGIAAIAGISMSGSETDLLPLYVEGLRSLAVARELARDPVLMRALFPGEWDSQAGRWREPPASLPSRLKSGLRSALGAPMAKWRPPGERELRDFLVKNIEVETSTKAPLTLVYFEHPDRKFALDFLTRLDRATDNLLRNRAELRASASIRYLSGELTRVELAEHRAALVANLAEQEQRRMLIRSPLPYAVEVFDPPSVSNATVTPQPPIVLLGAGILGILIGIGWSVVDVMRDRRGR
ncbi:MAG: hypothetical protein IOD08_03440 [Bradyrhizobium sp.]|uniref:hypothetical protein n=1 Tax=Bradyrhizobium sp. TaxID=376 RepID=UPI0025C3C45C|nr:hypothetical protein [Bradyrhizobium sp.]MCA3576317.1 hypothetical protein [Bradyrhizobium sp.]